jgi:predicted kinase
VDWSRWLWWSWDILLQAKAHWQGHWGVSWGGKSFLLTAQERSSPVYRFTDVAGPPRAAAFTRREMTSKTYDRLLQEAVDRISERRSLIIDATFGSRQHRANLREKLGTLGVDCCLIQTQASNEILKSRLIEREGKTNKVSDARFEDFEMLARSYERPAEVAQRGLITVDTESSLEPTLVETLKALVNRALCSAKK